MDTTCPQMSCLPVKRGDDVIEMIPKRLPPDHPIAKLPEAAGKDNFLCSFPACLSNPCLNHGTCEETLEGFLCRCKEFFSGVQCENIDECASNPCMNGSTCIDGVNDYHCDCSKGFAGKNCSIASFLDCEEILLAGHQSNGVYSVHTNCSSSATQVYCDMETTGGGWLVFQRRIDGATDFYRKWTAYKTGFGDIEHEFWLGNDNLHRLTSQKSYTLRVELEDWDSNTVYAEYSVFSITSEEDKYRLTVGGYSGTASNSLGRSNGYRFSTKDADNDPDSRHCAQYRHGAWWYRYCGPSHLNGRYYPSSSSTTTHLDGITWRFWKNNWHPLKKSEMKIRPN